MNSKDEEKLYQQEPLLKILPPKERAELENAIRETQKVLKSIEVFNFDSEKFDKAVMESINKMNKQSQEEMKKQEGFGLIGILFIIGVLVITAGGVVVWE